MYQIPYRKLIVVLVLLWISIGVFLIEFFSLPQVYYFNHVWGHWPGPIYDESVVLSRSYSWFRALTFLWVIVLWLIPEFRSSRKANNYLLMTLAAIVSFYLYLPQLGIVSPASYLKQQLRATYETEHLNLYADEKQFSEQEIAYWAARHEFHFDQIVDELEINWPEGRKIEAYLYGDAWQKKELVGAKFTSYVPVWLKQDQLHIAKEHLNAVLKHEMVHVISKQFGNRLMNASWSVGLVEGLAEAIAKDASQVSTLNQILAANPPYPDAQQMENALTFRGFYAGASGVSYTTAGSFVRYLLDEYPVNCFKEAYAGGDFEDAFDLPFDSLVNGWQHTLPEERVDSLDRQTAARVFSQQSLFQKPCPHSVSEAMQLWDDYLKLDVRDQDSLAFLAIQRLQSKAADNPLVNRELSVQLLKRENIDRAIEIVQEYDTLMPFPLYKADALASQGNWRQAEQTLSSIDSADVGTWSLAFRSDSIQWKSFLSIRYGEILPDSTTYSQLSGPLKWQAIQLALESGAWHKLKDFAQQLNEDEWYADFFDLQLELADKLTFIGEADSCRYILNRLKNQQLRDRYRERLDEQLEWLEFMIRYAE